MFHTLRLFTLICVLSVLFILQGCSNESMKPKPFPPSSDQPSSNTLPLRSPTDPEADDEDDMQSLQMRPLSEAFGHFIGKNLKNPGPRFHLESIISGMRKGYSGEPAPMAEEEYQEQMRKFEELAFQAVAENNLAEADRFMENVRNDPGLIELESGKLYYSVVAESQEEGNGVTDEHTPTIRYKGQFADGTIFGSSDDTGGTVMLSLKQTIPGFRQAVLGMKKGEARKIYVHPELGYGTSGQLPPNQILIFEVEMVDPETKPHYVFNTKTTPSTMTFEKQDSYDQDQGNIYQQDLVPPGPPQENDDQFNGQTLPGKPIEGRRLSNTDDDDEEFILIGDEEEYYE